MSCEVCSIGKKLYKCPTCLIAYCSVPCWKTHKETPCKHIQKSADECLSDNTNNKYMTESYINSEKLKRLEFSEKLKNNLKNPHLRHMLLAIDKADNPAEIMEKAMLEPIFTEFADECIKVVEPNEP